MKLSSQHKQLSPDLIKSSLDKLPKDNRWVRLGDSLVWDEIERIYNIRAKRPDTGAAWTAACYYEKRDEVAKRASSCSYPKDADRYFGDGIHEKYGNKKLRVDRNGFFTTLCGI